MTVSCLLAYCFSTDSSSSLQILLFCINTFLCMLASVRSESVNTYKAGSATVSVRDRIIFKSFLQDLSNVSTKLSWAYTMTGRTYSRKVVRKSLNLGHCYFQNHSSRLPCLLHQSSWKHKTLYIYRQFFAIPCVNYCINYVLRHPPFLRE